MPVIKDQENIDELRKRLYERGNKTEELKRHQLTPREIEVSRGWSTVPDSISTLAPSVAEESVATTPALVTEPSPTEATNTAETVSVEPTTTAKPKRRYRMVIMVASLLFFIITAAISSVYLFFGANQISGKNISLNLSAPIAIAGGETLNMQVGVSNQNSVAINSAVLIVNYPAGTRAVGEGARELYEERIPVADIAPGEAINIPLAVVLYGEENEEKQIKVLLEYRVAGSNGRFDKEADPQIIKISSSPIVVKLSGVEKISSGQELEMNLLIQSNSLFVQKNILISTSYPNSFSFSSASPEPRYGQNSWLIEELKPNEVKEITIKGIVAGLEDEAGEVQVKVGNPQLDNQFIMGAILSQAKHGYSIEQPFTGVSVEVNGDSDGDVVLSPETEAVVKVVVRNTLNKPIYNMKVDIKPIGNIIRDDLLKVSGGFYDASSKIIRYEVSGQNDLAEIGPGETREFMFSVKPDPNQTTASFKITTNIFAQRSDEGNNAESLIGTNLAEVKYSSEASFGSELGYSNGPFKDSGAVPPVAGLATTYTVTLVATAGINDMAGAVVITSLPQYVSWLDATEGDGKVEFNPVSKQIRWNVGDVSAKSSKKLSFQVSLLPSVTQVGRTAVVIGPQELKATDRFTGVNLRAQQNELYNELSSELGFIKDNGVIRDSN